MQQISIGQLQKNTAIFTSLKEAVEVVDKRKKEVVAFIYPAKSVSVVQKLAGKYHNRVSKIDDLERAKLHAITEAMKEKYGFSS